MMVTVRSLGLTGITGYEVSVECFLSGGLPGFDVVGLPDAAVKESRERVRAAVKNCGAKFPVSRMRTILSWICGCSACVWCRRHGSGLRTSPPPWWCSSAPSSVPVSR